MKCAIVVMSSDRKSRPRHLRADSGGIAQSLPPFAPLPGHAIGHKRFHSMKARLQGPIRVISPMPETTPPRSLNTGTVAGPTPRATEVSSG